MPIYEYRCGGCGHRFELLVRERTTFECPSCGGRELEKQLSVFAVASDGPRRSDSPPSMACGTCGHPDGPGSCAIN
ncbi:MAG: zinc ribbon domain-containing protein [Acidobacteriota bacterium]